jgi:putative nucleotidyltransferase with HDIG domain
MLTFAAMALAGLGYFLVNMSLSAAAVAVREGRSPIAVLVGDLRSFGLSLIGLAPLGWLMALAYTTVGPLVAVLFALPLYTTRASYQSVVEIRKMFTQTVRALASAIDARDPSTKQHSDHVSQIAVEIGHVMGVSEGQLEELEWGGLLHDIGKIGIRDAVLLKPGRLDKAERMLMNEHPEKGAEILKGVEKLAPEIPLIRHHHEWYNGSGYPDRLIGENIPFLARILHVADAFEAMTAVRPYRLRPMSASQAMEELRKYSGIQFDPVVVDAFAKTASAQGEPVPEVVMEAPIPMLGQVAALRAKGTVSAAVPFQNS